MKKKHLSPVVGLSDCTAGKAGKNGKVSNCLFAEGDASNANSAHLMMSDKDSKRYEELETAHQFDGSFGKGLPSESDQERKALFVAGVRAYNDSIGVESEQSDAEVLKALARNDRDVKISSRTPEESQKFNRMVAELGDAKPQK